MGAGRPRPWRTVARAARGAPARFRRPAWEHARTWCRGRTRPAEDAARTSELGSWVSTIMKRPALEELRGTGSLAPSGEPAARRLSSTLDT